MKELLRSVVFIFLTCGNIFAQSGNYFLTHYNPGNDNINYLSFDIEQDQKGVLYFANRSGVLQYDGRTWTIVPVNGAVYDLAVTPGGEVYAAGTEGFGRLTFDKVNHLVYQSASDSLPFSRNVFAATAAQQSVFFLNEQHVFKMDAVGNAKSLFIATPKHGHFTGLYEIGESLYVGTALAGLHKINGEKLDSVGIPGLPREQLIFSEASPDKSRNLLATEDNRLFLMGKALVELKPKDSTYLINHVIANASWITNTMIAVGTLRGGVVFMDTETGDILETTNYQTGLPDNEVYALHTDRHQGVWASHDYGFTRIAPFLPFRTFNHYRGLAGNLLCVQSVGDRVYTGTSLGLFLLTSEEIYEEETYIVTVNVKIKPVVKVQEQEVKKEKKVLGLFRKKKQAPVPPAQVQPEPMSQKKGIKKTRKILKGVEYVYKKVEGISGKVDQMILVGDRLLCSGVGGVFEVVNLKATPVFSDPVRTIYYSRILIHLLVSTYDDEVNTFQSNQSVWTPSSFPDSLSSYADYFFEDNVQNLWICGRDKATKIGIEDGEILDAETIPLPHVSIDRTVGLASGNDVYLTQNGEFFHYASYKNIFVKNDSLPGPKKYFASAGYFWFYDGHRWRTVDPRRQGSMKTEWLGLFSDIRFLAPAVQGKSLWIITASNELYKYSAEWDQSQAATNPLFLKGVRNQDTSLSLGKDLQVDERESAITLEFIQPEYVSLQAVEYRYWVKGLQKEWTEWSSLNNVISFPFLPSGDYQVVVQAKDLFGKITEFITVNFKVVPPYWKRPWFYALEFVLFGLLVVLSLRLNVSSGRYRYLSRFLSALTIIMLIQFIQTIVAANITFKSTPVAEFFVQVLIALLVLPVEEFLRKRIMKADAQHH